MTPTNQKRLVLVGATGMVGGYAIRYALGNATVAAVTAIARRKLGISHPKLREVLHSDFADCSSLSPALSCQDAAVFCLGAYTGAVSDTELRRITVDYTIEFARVLHVSSPNSSFSFLSGNGAGSAGQSRVPIYPVQPRKEPNFSYRLLRAIYPAFQLPFPNLVIRADDLAHAMVDVSIEGTGHETRVFENRDIRTIVKSVRLKV
jgi:hypothetical protein